MRNKSSILLVGSAALSLAVACWLLADPEVTAPTVGTTVGTPVIPSLPLPEEPLIREALDDVIEVHVLEGQRMQPLRGASIRRPGDGGAGEVLLGTHWTVARQGLGETFEIRVDGYVPVIGMLTDIIGVYEGRHCVVLMPRPSLVVRLSPPRAGIDVAAIASTIASRGRTDIGGTAALPGELGADYSVAVTDPRVWFETARVKDLRGRQEVVLRQVNGGHLAGTVLQAGGDVAIATAKVCVRPTGGSAPVVMTSCDAAGRYQLSLAAGWYLVWAVDAETAGISPGSRVQVEEHTSLDLELEPIVRLHGKALDRGSPVAAAEVRIEPRLSDALDAGTVTWPRVATDSQGEYSFRVRPSRSGANVIATAGDKRGSLYFSRGPAARLPPEEYHDIDLHGWASIRGRVVDAGGAPVQRAKITIYPNATETITRVEHTWSGEDGRYQIRCWTGHDVVMFSVQAPGHEDLFQVRPAKESEWPLLMTRTPGTRCTCAYEDGTLAAGVALTFFDSVNPDKRWVATTQEDGSVWVPFEDPQRVVVRGVDAEVRAVGMGIVGAGMPTLRIGLGRRLGAGTILGTLQGVDLHDDLAKPGVEVNGEPCDAQFFGSLFRINAVHPGTSTITFRLGRRRAELIARVEPGRTVDVGEVPLQ